MPEIWMLHQEQVTLFLTLFQKMVDLYWKPIRILALPVSVDVKYKRVC